MNPADAMQALPPPDMSLFNLFWHAHLVVKLVMVGLLGCSVWCWAIIVDKTLLFRRTKAEMDAFEEAFWSGRSLEELYRSFNDRQPTGLGALFVAAMREWKRSFEGSGRQIHSLSQRIDKVLDVTIQREVERLESRLLFLASIGSAGPYVGLFACSEKLVRQMPGRLCGETVDAEGKRGFVLTLSTREQHIRREKATSNICTNSGLCALAFSIHMTLLGEAGLRQLAAVNHAGAVAAADRLSQIPGVELINDSFFNEFTLKLPVEARPVVRTLADRGILAGVSLGRLYPGKDDLANGLVVAVTETTTAEDVETLATALSTVLGEILA